MEERDQEVRQGITVASFADTVLMREMRAVDSAHTERLRQIVEAYGWPGIRDVGEDGAHAAWLLLQHSADREFRRGPLPLMEEAANRGEASLRSLALLTDRVLIAEGEPQRYGTRFRFVGGGIEFHPIEGPESVDERRATRSYTERRLRRRTRARGQVDWKSRRQACARGAWESYACP